MSDAMERLRLQAGQWGLELSTSRLSVLGTYADLLAEYRLANVIGTKDRDKIVLEHLLDALSCLVVREMRAATSLVDVGTGAGLPGIPLGIVRPELSVTLIEAAEKKASFLYHAREVLGLHNVEVLRARAEDVGKASPYREVFDLATTRALAALPVVVEYCAPLVRRGGVLLAMKGRLSEEELSAGVMASHELGVELREIRAVTYHVQVPQKEYSLVVFDKVGAVSSRYPRRVGLAKNRPLGT